TRGTILVGSEDSPVSHVLHIFPHTGFTVEHLREAKNQFPESDTLLASLSRVRLDNHLIEEARKLGLQFILGNCHVLEIYENGLPLAHAIQQLLPDLEVVVHRERVTAFPLKEMGNAKLQEYAYTMAMNYLVNKVPSKVA